MQTDFGFRITTSIRTSKGMHTVILHNVACVKLCEDVIPQFAFIPVPNGASRTVIIKVHDLDALYVQSCEVEDALYSIVSMVEFPYPDQESRALVRHTIGGYQNLFEYLEGDWHSANIPASSDLTAAEVIESTISKHIDEMQKQSPRKVDSQFYYKRGIIHGMNIALEILRKHELSTN